MLQTPRFNTILIIDVAGQVALSIQVLVRGDRNQGEVFMKKTLDCFGLCSIRIFSYSVSGLAMTDTPKELPRNDGFTERRYGIGLVLALYGSDPRLNTLLLNNVVGQARLNITN